MTFEKIISTPPAAMKMTTQPQRGPLSLWQSPALCSPLKSHTDHPTWGSHATQNKLETSPILLPNHLKMVKLVILEGKKNETHVVDVLAPLICGWEAHGMSK